MFNSVDGFRIFVAVALAALIAVRFYDRESPANEQQHIAWLALASFVTGFLAYDWVTIVCFSVCVVAAVLGFVPVLLQLFLSEHILRPKPEQFGLGHNRQNAKIAGPLIRDLRKALQSGDTKLAEETLSWWEEKNGKP